MKFKISAGFLLILLIFSLVIIPAAAVSASGPQSWNLDSHEDSDVLVPPELCQMEKRDGPGDNGQSGSIILLGNGGSQIWIADQAATANVVFHSVPTTWNLELVTDTNWDEPHIDTGCLAEIGEWDGAGFNKFNSAIQQLTFVLGNRIIVTLISQDANEIIHKDCYLAIRVTNNENIEHVIFTGEQEDSTCLTSHGGDPGYPEPEPPDVPVSSSQTTGWLIGSFAVLIPAVILTVRRRTV